MNYASLFREIFKEFIKRFWIFILILYGAEIISELFRQVLLENLTALAYREYGQAFFMAEVFKEFAARPVLLLLPLASLFFSLWGFSALYFALSEQNIKNSVAIGLKRLSAYSGFVAAASMLTAIGLGILSIPSFLILREYSVLLPPLASNLFSITTLLFLVLGLPGFYLLISFSIGPFILLLENKGVVGALLESHKRVFRRWLWSALFLGISFAAAGIVYATLSWLIFTLKLSLVPTLSLRGEAILRIFFYSLPWAISATFFELSIYKLYRVLAEPIGPANQEAGKKPFSLTPNQMKITSIVVLIAFTFSFGVFPIPVFAWSGLSVVGAIVGIFLAVASFFCAGCGLLVLGAAGGLVDAVALAYTIGLGVGIFGTIAQTITTATCSGSYDAILGTCSYSSGKQSIYTKQNTKFLKINFGEKPTPEEFSADPSVKNLVTLTWKADAPDGVREYLRLADNKTGEEYVSSKVNTCTASILNPFPAEMTDVFALPYGHSFLAKIDFEMCVQIEGGKKTKSLKPLCIFQGPPWQVAGGTTGCGCDPALTKLGITPCGTLVKTDFVTPKLPIKVDLKANNSDKKLSEKNKPITLSWTTEYATSCQASGSWSGDKSAKGSETVIPSQGNEVYILTCHESADSIGFNVGSQPGIGITNSPSVDFGGSGSLGNLKITEFNSTNPLNPGDTVYIGWNVQGAVSCEIDNGIGKIPCTGSAEVTFVKTTTFTLIATDAGGTKVSATKTILVKKVPSVKEVRPE